MTHSRFAQRKLTFLAIGGGVLLWAGWPPSPLFPFLCLGFVPLLMLEDELQGGDIPPTGWQLFGYGFLFFVTWNALTTWWIWHASPGGAIFAIITNSLVMSIPYMLFSRTKRILGSKAGYLSLIVFWVAFEFLHYKWELAWPWLNLGNGLATFPVLAQWYEYTGTLGGTAWLLAINIFLFQLIQRLIKRGKWAQTPILLQMAKPAVAILLPVFFSLSIYLSYEEQGQPQLVTIIQPNFDPYERIQHTAPADTQLTKLLTLSDNHTTRQTDYLVWPEVAIPGNIWLGRMSANQHLNRIDSFMQKYPETSLIAGFSGYKRYDADDPPTPTARYFNGNKCCYDAYNSALQLTPDGNFDVYHKSKLVPGVERMPYPWLFRFLKPIASRMGGIIGSLGTQEHREVFFARDSIGMAPAICYESVFGEYITQYINNGANGIVIITNDGWWGNTAGYRQHKAYASLRAIETRKPVIRSANTGISCFIDQRGYIEQQTGWWEPAAINQEVLVNDNATFYTRYGDYLGRMSALAAIGFLLTGFVKRKMGKI